MGLQPRRHEIRFAANHQVVMFIEVAEGKYAAL